MTKNPDSLWKYLQAAFIALWLVTKASCKVMWGLLSWEIKLGGVEREIFYHSGNESPWYDPPMCRPSYGLSPLIKEFGWFSGTKNKEELCLCTSYLWK